MQDNRSDFITRSELRSMLGIHPETCRRWERAGRLTPYFLTAGVVRYRRTDVGRLLIEARLSQRRRPGPKPKPRPSKANPQPAL